MIKKSLLILAATAVSATATQPNILFLITDDQFKHDMNFFPEGRDADGKPKNLSPNVDRLAKEGTVMRRQYVTSPVCTPSRYTCVTGLYPSRSKAHDFLRAMKNNDGQSVVQWNTFVTDEAGMLPKKFQEAGYFTGVVGKNHFYTCDDKREKTNWGANPEDHKVVEILKRNQAMEIARAKEIGFDFAASLYYNNPVENGVKALACHNMAWIAEGAHQFIDAAKASEKPFYLYLATTVPHGPMEDDRSWAADRRITGVGMREKPIDLLPDADSIRQRLKDANIKGRGRENILYMDDFVGSVLKKLEESGQLENTIIVYFNDHGQKAKGTVYEGGVHSEAVVWKKGGFPIGGECHTPVSNVDLVPTMLDLAGVKYDQDIYDGRSFAPLLNGGEVEDRSSLYFELGFVRGVLKGKWKYIALRYPKNATEMTQQRRKIILDKFNEEQKRKERPVYTKDEMEKFSHVSLIPGGGDAEHMSMGKYPAYYEADQLYNLEDDPNEQKNLIADPANAELIKELKAELKGHLAELPGTFGEFKTE